MTLLFLARIRGRDFRGNGATIGTAQAVIADSTPPDKRKHGMALIGAAFGIGFTFGPLFGYAALKWFPDQLEAVGYTAAALSLLAFLAGFFMLPETRKWADTAAEPTSGARRSWNLGALFRAFGDPAVGAVILVFFLSTARFRQL